MMMVVMFKTKNMFMTEMVAILVMVMNIGYDKDNHDEDHDNCADNNANADPLYLGLLGGVCKGVVWMSIAYTLLEIQKGDAQLKYKQKT